MFPPNARFVMLCHYVTPPYSARRGLPRPLSRKSPSFRNNHDIRHIIRTQSYKVFFQLHAKKLEKITINKWECRQPGKKLPWLLPYFNPSERRKQYPPLMSFLWQLLRIFRIFMYPVSPWFHQYLYEITGSVAPVDVFFINCPTSFLRLLPLVSGRNSTVSCSLGRSTVSPLVRSK